MVEDINFKKLCSSDLKSLDSQMPASRHVHELQCRMHQNGMAPPKSNGRN
jgi:hypothetical protein